MAMLTAPMSAENAEERRVWCANRRFLFGVLPLFLVRAPLHCYLKTKTNELVVRTNRPVRAVGADGKIIDGKIMSRTPERVPPSLA